VALSLLFLGCERDEVQQPSSPTLTQQEAMNLFFKNYQRHKDDYCDVVAENLLAMNDSTGIIFDLVHRFGQPRWEVERSSASKSARRLFVPVVVPGVDSVSAVFIFLDSANITQLKVAAWTNPDTLVRDFVMQYQSHLYGRSGVAGRYAERLDPGTKDWEVWEYCTNTCTSRDGHTCYEVIYSSCSYRLVWMGAEDTEISFISDKTLDEGGGEDTGDPSDPEEEPNSPNTSTLSDPAKNNLKNAETKLKNGPCLSETVIGNTWNNSLTITINGGITDISRYNSLTGKLEFRDVGSITDRVLLHELLHAYQARLYGSDYVHTQTHEFEAWLLVDLYLFSQNMDKNNLTWTRDIPSIQTRTDYYNWVKSIYENGFTTGLGGNSNMCTYWRDSFITAVQKYKDLPKGTSTFPQTIDNLITKCKN